MADPTPQDDERGRAVARQIREANTGGPIVLPEEFIAILIKDERERIYDLVLNASGGGINAMLAAVSTSGEPGEDEDV